MKEAAWMAKTSKTFVAHPGHWRQLPDSEGSGFVWVPEAVHSLSRSGRTTYSSVPRKKGA